MAPAGRRCATNTRQIRKVVHSKPTVEGAGVHLRRAFGFAEAPSLDPFLLLDDFRSKDPSAYLPGFPWHPHRGIETITYVLGGQVEHGDSMGNAGVIGPGDVQWMTSGSGIIHQEMPRGDAAGYMGGFQLWANLPASHKMMDPRYRGLTSSEIPQVTTANGAGIKVIAGEVEGMRGAVRDIVIDPEYLDITVPAGTTFRHPTKPGYTVMAYVIEGAAAFCESRDPFSYDVEGAGYFDMARDPQLADGALVLFDDGEEVLVATAAEKVRFLLMAGRPLREPVAWYGPIVMNTRQELQTAFEEYRRGTFIKQRAE